MIGEKKRNNPLYVISAASKMLEVHPQTLRMYERDGLITPQRINRQRMYSEEDIERLDLVIKLTKELGVNKAGVDIILRMRERLCILNRELSGMMNHLDDDIRAEFEKRFQSLFQFESNFQSGKGEKT